MTGDFDLLRKAVGLAARKHQGQLRKDGQTPYVAHPIRVCLAVGQLFGVNDPKILAAAVLHDIIEDTSVDRDDLIADFGDEIAAWVAALSKDARLPEAEREEAYRKAIRAAPWQVKVIKLADTYDNLCDASAGGSPAKTRAKARAMLPAIEHDLPERFAGAVKLVRERASD
ncbi:MAG TPA: HD domain-containing protein [Planctomycetota bacterium]|nr:HD domain-containing protein [Planctomycetota bacterium]